MSESRPKESSTWRVVRDVAEMGSRLATVMLAIVAFVATQAYNENQERLRVAAQKQQAMLQQVQTVTGLFDHLASSDSNSRRLAVITVKQLTADLPLALELCLAVASQGECAHTAAEFRAVDLVDLATRPGLMADPVQQTVQVALDRQQAHPDRSSSVRPLAGLAASAPDRGDTVTITGAEPAPSGQVRQGWVYLGSYSDERWLTRYLEFSDTANPIGFVSRDLRVRHETGALNVRRNRFYEPGYDRILDVLKTGSTVTVDSVRSYADGGLYFWAYVRYRTR